VLRAAGLADSQKQGRHVEYSLTALYDRPTRTFDLGGVRLALAAA
jgi:hypothetical protein